MNIHKSNITYRMGSNTETVTLQTAFNSLKGKVDMKKASVCLVDVDWLEQTPDSMHIIELEDNATDVDLLEQISELEAKTDRVCSDWSWITPRTVADIKITKLNNSKPFCFNDAVVEVH